jgi:hypothetical protein
VNVNEAIARQPGALAGQIAIHDDFNELTEQNERGWHGE